MIIDYGLLMIESLKRISNRERNVNLGNLIVEVTKNKSRLGSCPRLRISRTGLRRNSGKKVVVISTKVIMSRGVFGGPGNSFVLSKL